MTYPHDIHITTMIMSAQVEVTLNRSHLGR